MFAKITMTVSKLGGATEDFRNDLKGNSWLSGRRMTLEKRKILERPYAEDDIIFSATTKRAGLMFKDELQKRKVKEKSRKADEELQKVW